MPLFPQPPNPNLVQSLVLLSTEYKTDRKLYIGNLPAGLTQQTLVQLLNNTILSVKTEGFAPIISAWISADGDYAFVEFRSPEEAHKKIF
jgi:splicing factor U2AF subunit